MWVRVVILATFLAFIDCETVNGWKKLEKAQGNSPVVLNFALQHRNQDELEHLFWSVSDPLSEHYGTHLRPEDVQQMFSPAPEAVIAMTQWVESTWGKSVPYRFSAHRDYLSLYLTVVQAEAFLRAPCHVWQSTSNSGRKIISSNTPDLASVDRSSSSSYNIESFAKPGAIFLPYPPIIESYVSYVSGVNRLPSHHMSANRVISKEAVAASSEEEEEEEEEEGNSIMSETVPAMSMSILQRQKLWQSQAATEKESTAADGQGENSQQNSSNYNNGLPDGFQLVTAQPGDQTATFVVQVLCPDGTLPSFAYSDFKCDFDGNMFFLNGISITRAKVDGQASTTLLSLGSIPFVIQLAQAVLTVKHLDNFVPYEFSFQLSWQNIMGAEKYYTVPYTRTLIPSPLKTPEMIKTWYGFPEGVAATKGSSNSQAVAAIFLSPDNEGYYSRKDLKQFYQRQGIAESNIDLVHFTGAQNNPSAPDIEIELDVQWITGIAPGIETFVWHDSLTTTTPFEDIIQSIQHSGHVPTVLTFSYGSDEQMYYSMEKDLTNHINNQFKLLGLQGVSVLVSSGDSGAYSRAQGCSGGFRATFPGSSPYVTSVGATQLSRSNDSNRKPHGHFTAGNNKKHSSSVAVDEVACSAENSALITTGGGFSALFPQPSYQKEAVDHYLRSCSSSIPPSHLFSSKNRAFPDIAFFGHGFEVIFNGQVQPVDGTSASAPALAGFFALINDARLKKGQHLLGFLNPLLYQLAKEHPEAFTDVVSGNNRCLTQTQECCKTGFSGCAGWDAVSGIGTPRFDKLASHLVKGGLDGKSRPYGVLKPNTQQAVGSASANTSNSSYTILIIAGLLFSVFSAALYQYSLHDQRSQYTPI